MKPFSELRDDELAAALLAVRPEPSPAFAAELDERVAAGFPRRSPSPEGGDHSASYNLADWLRSLSPRRLLLPAGGLALTALVVATVVVVGSGSHGGSSADVMTSATSAESTSGAAAGGDAAAGGEMEAAESAGGSEAAGGLGTGTAQAPSAGAPSLGAAGSEEAAGAEESGIESEAEVEGEIYDRALGAEKGGAKAAPAKEAAPKNSPGAAADVVDRDVERGAQITLGTKPGEVGEASAKVFQTVHSYDGIVMNSSTTNGSGSDAEARFELLIPSAKFNDAMAAFSQIGEVRSRHEATQDITTPTVGASERLQDSNARIEGLLAQLAEATTDPEREAVEAELSSERAHAARLKATLTDLKRRANLSHVSLRIESGRGALSPADKKDDGAWGIGDALDDAGHLLATAAGILIVAFAVAAPLALLLVLAWLAGRVWTRRARERALAP